MTKYLVSSLIAIVGFASPALAAQSFTAVSSSVQGPSIDQSAPVASIMNVMFKNTSSAKASLSPSLSNSKFTILSNRCISVSKNRSCVVSVSVSPAGLTSNQSAVLSSASSDSVSLSVAVTGKVLAPASLAFADSAVTIQFSPSDKAKIFAASISNSGGTAAIPQVTIPSGMQAILNRCVAPLKPGRSCIITLSVNKVAAQVVKSLSLSTGGSEAVTVIPAVQPDLKQIQVNLDSDSHISYQFLAADGSIDDSKIYADASSLVSIPSGKKGIRFHWEHNGNPVPDNVQGHTFGSYSVSNIANSSIVGEYITIQAADISSGAAISVAASTDLSLASVSMTKSINPSTAYTLTTSYDNETEDGTTSSLQQLDPRYGATSTMILRDDAFHMVLEWQNFNGDAFPGWAITGVDGLTADEMTSPTLDIRGGRLQGNVSVALNEVSVKTKNILFQAPAHGSIHYKIFNDPSQNGYDIYNYSNQDVLAGLNTSDTVSEEGNILSNQSSTILLEDSALVFYEYLPDPADMSDAFVVFDIQEMTIYGYNHRNDGSEQSVYNFQYYPANTQITLSVLLSE